MSNKIHYITIISVFLFGIVSAKGQDYHYQNQYSTQTYVENTTDTTSVLLPQFDDTYQLPIGFSFTCAGKTIDTLKLRMNGLLTFDDMSQYNFIFLNKNFLFDMDENNLPLSSINLLTTVDSSSHHILKIEFKNVMLVRGDDKIHFNFQVWLYEYTNAIEFHMGTTTGSISEDCLMGLINMDNTSEAALGFLLQGDPAAPTGTYIGAMGALTTLTSLPAATTVYTFTPITN